jgi:hypothetical protein
MSIFFNYEAWLSDPTNIGHSVQVVWPRDDNPSRGYPWVLYLTGVSVGTKFHTWMRLRVQDSTRGCGYVASPVNAKNIKNFISSSDNLTWVRDLTMLKKYNEFHLF